MMKLGIREYVSAWGEVRIVSETVDEKGVARITDVVDRSRRGQKVERHGEIYWIKVKS